MCGLKSYVNYTSKRIQINQKSKNTLIESTNQQMRADTIYQIL